MQTHSKRSSAPIVTVTIDMQSNSDFNCNQKLLLASVWVSRLTRLVAKVSLSDHERLQRKDEKVIYIFNFSKNGAARNGTLMINIVY